MMIYRKQAEMRSLLKVLLLASLLSTGLVAAAVTGSCGAMKGKTFTLVGSTSSSVQIVSEDTVAQVVKLDASHVLCSVTKSGETEVKLYKLKTDETSLSAALTEVVKETDPLKKEDRTYQSLATNVEICTGANKFYTTKLSDGSRVHITCKGNDAGSLAVFRGNLLDCEAVKRVVATAEAQFGSGTPVSIAAGAKVKHAATLTETHLLCKVTEAGQDERLVKLDTTGEQTDKDVLTEVELEATLSLEAGTKLIPGEDIPDDAKICSSKPEMYTYTLKLANQEVVHYVLFCNEEASGLRVGKELSVEECDGKKCSNTPDSESNGLSSGAVAGIAIAAAVVSGVIGLVVGFKVLRRDE